MDLCLRYLEHILWRAALVIGEGFLAGHALRLRLQDQAKRLSALSVKKRKGLFAAHMEQQVSFADAASQDDLDRVHTAGVIFADAYDLLIRRQASRVSTAAQAQTQKRNGIQRCLVADGQTAAFMTMKLHTFFPQCFILVHTDISFLFRQFIAAPKPSFGFQLLLRGRQFDIRPAMPWGSERCSRRWRTPGPDAAAGICHRTEGPDSGRE